MSGEVFCIISLVPQNGAKYLATNLGYFMKKRHKNKKVLLIDFDFDNPTLCYHYTKNSIYSIDNLASLDIANKFDRKNFKNSITELNMGVDILKGTSIQNINTFPNIFTKNFFAKIINMSKEFYDYVFVVTNHDVNKSETLVTLLNSNKVLLVIKNNYTNALKLDKYLLKISEFKDDKNDIKIISNFNEYDYGIKTFNQSMIEGIAHLALLDYVPKSIDNSNLDSKNIFKRRTINDVKFKEICKKITR